jgi:hypothetical protein
MGNILALMGPVCQHRGTIYETDFCYHEADKLCLVSTGEREEVEQRVQGENLYQAGETRRDDQRSQNKISMKRTT